MCLQNSNHISSGNNTRALSRVITAAVVNRTFRDLLLNNPDQALSEGYNSESFALQDDEREHILSINAQSVSDLAAQLAHVLTNGGTS